MRPEGSGRWAVRRMWASIFVLHDFVEGGGSGGDEADAEQSVEQAPGRDETPELCAPK